MRARLIDPAGVQRQAVEVTACTAVLRDCGVGTWQIEATADTVAQVGEGWRVLIPGVCSGPVTSREMGVQDQQPVVTLTGVSELTALADHLTYPVPSKAATDQSEDAYYRASGPAETVIRGLVHVNAGTGALAARRTPFFTVTTSQGRGSTVTVETRWKNVLDEAVALARTGGVTFDAIWEGAQAVLRFRVPRDLSRRCRFGGPLGGLDDVKLSLNAPTVTDVVVAGQGQGTARAIRSYSSATTWGRRVEAFKDRRDTEDAAEYDKAGADALAEGAASATASFTLSEVPGLVYGTDYQLGDTVTVTYGGVQVSEPVRQVELTWDGHGRTAKVILGDHDQADDNTPVWVAKIRALDARLRVQETI